MEFASPEGMSRVELTEQERRLARSEARFRAIIERNADAILVVARDGTIRFANLAAEHLFGRASEDLVGSMFGFPMVAGETIEVDLVVAGAARIAEMRVVQSEWEDEEAHIASLRDVTERIHAEQDARRLIREQAARTAAEQSAARMRFLAESSAVLAASLDYDATLAALAHLCVPRLADWSVVYGLDEDGHPYRAEVAHCEESRSELVNRLKGLPISGSGTHSVREVLRTGRAVVERDVTDEVLANMAETEDEREIARTLGAVSYMLVPMIARGSPVGAIAFVSSNPDRRFEAEDLTLAEDIALRGALAGANSRLYSQAKAANQTKSDFLAVVSHDLRTPLTAITGYADLLRMGIPEPLSPGSLERVERIRTSANHLQYLLNELLTFARLDAQHEKKHATSVDLRALLRDVESVVEPLVQQQHLRLQLQLPGNPVVIVTDADKVRQIVLNLATNAVRYTRDGSVTISLTRAADQAAQIEVRDTGIGIAEENLSRIFDPFWQVSPAQRAQGGGTGLGLSIVKRLISLIGGRIDVRSKIGDGSSFIVTLPAATSES